MEGADPEFFGHLPVDTGPQLPLFDGRQRAPGLTELALRQALGQQELQTLLHFPRRLVGESHGQHLCRINPMGTDQMGNAMGEGSCFAAAGTCHHQ